METARLSIRKFSSADLDGLFCCLSDEKSCRYEPYDPYGSSDIKDELQKRIDNPDYQAVIIKQTGQMIGSVYLSKREFDSYELGYIFNSDYWKRGYATEACKAMIDDAFDSGVHRIYAMTCVTNTDSWKLLERLGMIREGRIKKYAYYSLDEGGNRIWQDSYLYSIIGQN